MNGWTIFETLALEIQQPLLAMVDAMISALTGPVGQVFRAGVVVMLAWLMLKAAITGGSGNPISDLEGKLILSGAVFILASQGAVYHTYIADLFLQKMGQEISALIGGGSGAISGQTFDKIYNTAYVAGLATYKALSWTDIGLQILVVVYWLVALLAIGLGFLIWMSSYVLLALFIGTGPLFVAMYPFGALKSISERWLGAVIAAIILQVFVVALLTILTGAETNMIGKIVAVGSGNAMQQLQLLLGGLALFFVCGLILTQLPGAASSLSGGLAFHAGGIVAGMSAAGAGAASATGAAVSGIAAGGRAVSSGVRSMGSGSARPAAGRSLSS